MAGCFLLAGCGTDPNTYHVGCQQISHIDVGSGLTPSIGWSPGCRVAVVAVYDAVPIPPPQPGEDPVPPLPGSGQDQTPGYTPGNLLWRLTSSNVDVAGNLIEPSVRYGRIPGNAVEQPAATPLVAGGHYMVQLNSRYPDLQTSDQHWRTLFQP